MGLSSPGQAEIVSLESSNIDDVLSKALQLAHLRAAKNKK